MWAVKEWEPDAGRLSNLLFYFVRNHALVVEIMHAMLCDQAAGEIAWQEVLKFNVAGAIGEARNCEINGTDSPEAKSENDCVGANAARGDPRGGV